MLGDNLFYGDSLQHILRSADEREQGATIFAYRVTDPERYGVVEFNEDGRAIALTEKPSQPKSHYAVPGLYFYDNLAPELAKTLKPSPRGELEITDLNQLYLENESLWIETMGRGYAWLDTGTHESMIEAHQFVQTIEHRQGLKIACPEEIAFNNKWINAEQLQNLAAPMLKNSYGKYLTQILLGRRSLTLGDVQWFEQIDALQSCFHVCRCLTKHNLGPSFQSIKIRYRGRVD